MRVLITSVSAYGHLQPLIPLAKALMEARHEVAIATGPDLRIRAEAAGFTAFEAGLTIDEAFGRLADIYPDQPYNRLAPSEILGWYLPHLFGEVLAPAVLKDLEAVVQNWKPDVVVHETWEFAGPIVAAKSGIPSVCQTLGLRIDDTILDAVAAAVAPLWRECGLMSDPTAGLYRTFCLDTTPVSLQDQKLARNRDVMHPMRPVAEPPVPGEVLPQWIEQRRNVPLVYMTLGTNSGTNSDVSMFRSVIDGLEGLDIDVLITIGFGKDPSTTGPLPENIHVENYVPQSLLLPHCSTVICHGGPGTILHSLAHGLPLLILPQGADQYVMGERVLKAGVGLRLVPADVNPESVRSSVLALLEETIYKVGASRLQREIEEMPGPDEAVHLIEEVVGAVVRG
jgi:UDP:flavonoid glycosyltransferase YjiC (YdhE family)